MRVGQLVGATAPVRFDDRRGPMNEDAPVISVVMPVRNGGPLLTEQLSALAQQTFDGPWELIVADNGSTDGTPRVVESWADRLPVRVVDASGSRGPAHARNVGSREARADVIAYVDADDVVDARWLAEISSAVAPDALVAGAYDATQLNPPAVLQARGLSERARRLFDGPAHFLPYGGSANFAIGKPALLAIGGWDESLRTGEDVELCWRAQLAGYELRFCAGAVVNYRFREGLRPLFRQTFEYARNEVELYRRYRDRGARRRNVAEVAERYWWVLSRTPYLALGQRRRTVWVNVVAEQLGRIAGSIRSRIVYL